MRVGVKVFLVFVIWWVLIGRCFATPPSAAWEASWVDEFDGTKIDTSKWSYGSLPWGGKYHNDEYASYIMSEDSYVTNGMLVLRCRKASGKEFGGYPYSEGFVHSNGKLNFTYGYVEIRARYPRGKGVWPAFWMLPQGWPPEIDIAEYFGSQDRMHMGLCVGTASNPIWDSSNFYGEGVDSWHTWGLEWGPGYLIWRKDGVIKKTVFTNVVPSVPMYVILNSGMRWDADSSTPLPNYFYVDWFRRFNPPAVVLNDSDTNCTFPVLRYEGRWGYAKQNGAFFGDNHWSSDTNAYLEVTFAGTRLDLYGALSTNHGVAAISVDHGPEVLVDYYASSRRDMALIWSISGLRAGIHEVRVRPTETKNSASSGFAIAIDRIDIWHSAVNLAGSIVGTPGAYGGSGNTKEKVFDGNLRTFFDAPVASGGWVGLDLGSPRVIKRILFAPRVDYANRMVGGRFQGANQPDFTDALDLYVITETPFEQRFNSVEVNVDLPVRYVRYLGPTNGYCNVAEIEFYGTTPGDANGVWKVDADGFWSDPVNWLSNTVAKGAGYLADFSAIDITDDRTVEVTNQIVIGEMRFADRIGAQRWVLCGNVKEAAMVLDPARGVPPIISVTNQVDLAVPLVAPIGFKKVGPGTLRFCASNWVEAFVYLDSGSAVADDGVVCLAHPCALSGRPLSVWLRNNNSGRSGLQLDGSAGRIVIPCELVVSCRNHTAPALQNLSGTNTVKGEIKIEVGGQWTVFQSDGGQLELAGGIRYVGTSTASRNFLFSGAGDFVITGPIREPPNSAIIGLVKDGPGRLWLNGRHSYNGPTKVSAGTLTLMGQIDSTNQVEILGGTFGGSGVIAGPVKVGPSGTISPGPGIGILKVKGCVQLEGIVELEIDPVGRTNDVIECESVMLVGGRLVINSFGGSFEPGLEFTLLKAPTIIGAFERVDLPQLPLNYTWDTNALYSNGRIRVVLANPPSLPNLGVDLIDNRLRLRWPRQNMGWLLQMQVCTLESGLGTNWIDIPESTVTNEFSFLPPSTNKCVFFRLIFRP